jgi:hypothetical protein
MAIQIIQGRPKDATAAQKLAGGIDKGLETIKNHLQGKEEKDLFKKQQEAISQLIGEDVSHIKDPKILEHMVHDWYQEKTKEFQLEKKLQGKNKEQERQFEQKKQLQENQLNGREREQERKLEGKNLEKKDKQAEGRETQRQLTNFADSLESRDPKFKAVADIYRLDIPIDQKTKIVQSITGTDLYREDQQKRLKLDSILKRYDYRIKEIDDEIRNVINPNSSGRPEADELRKQRMALRNERDQLLDYKVLNGMEDNEEDFDEEGKDNKGEGPTVMFDASNPKHKAVAEKLYKKYGDKEKVRTILRKNFKGL